MDFALGLVIGIGMGLVLFNLLKTGVTSRKEYDTVRAKEGKELIMCDPFYIANELIYRSRNEKVSLSPMKLQKILYFIYRNYLQKTSEPLFSERFQTWKYGPVLYTVYSEFKKYEANGITDYYFSSDGKAYSISEEEVLNNVINDVWNQCKRLGAIQLAELTHREEGAWYRAFERGSPILDDSEIMKDTIAIAS